MAKLEVLENKKLVLKNVLVHELRDISLDSLEDEINRFINKLDVLKVQGFGPLITKNFGTNISDEGYLTTNYDLMIQAHDYTQYKNIYKTYDKLTAEHCVYVRFSDHPQYSNFAHDKINLHFYEKELISSDVTYSIIVEEKEELLIMDLFVPVKTL
ncbi:AraC family transcriptional regulator [Erysipelothrix urinaevulpis]|uniref:AraC family transcriptional regulator n=1 Tax=Erysipelothrix urinaevulpis TaxID=2683717 RepID=UPI001357CE91|nr:AraC family transcriptional regulator [Erysipelothrix urinaevulpis]